MVENLGRHDTSGLNTLWNNMLNPVRGVAAKVGEFFSPPAEAAGNEQYYEIAVELPGVAEKDIDIKVSDNVLIVKGERRFDREEQGKTYYFSEHSYGRFQRTFRLPGDVDADKISATYTDGVLTVRLAKKSSGEANARTIEISTG